LVLADRHRLTEYCSNLMADLYMVSCCCHSELAETSFSMSL
jgi:hypothetical protein